MDSYDVLWIGAGPAGYVGAIRSAQLGLRVACADRWLDGEGKASLGGTCLNVGCIPSKALLDSSEQYYRAQHQFPAHGITVGELSIDVPAMQGRKEKLVAGLTGGIKSLFKKNGVEWLQGSARLVAPGEVEITLHDGSLQTVRAKAIVIATGSVPVEIPVAPLDGERIVDSSGALSFTEVPQRLGIIGAGVIGLELGSVWRRLGAEVTVLEAMPELLPPVDRDIARQAARSYKSFGLDIHLGAKVTGAVASADGVEVTFEEAEGEQQLQFDRLVVAVGRRPTTDGLGLESAGLTLSDRGTIEVDGQFATALPGVYAVGDVIGGPMLAHKASEEGVALAEIIAGQSSHLNYEVIPWIIYTWPEIAWVGKSEQVLQQEGVAYKVGSFPFAASGRARAMEESVGLVKVLADAESDQILGVHIIGPYASELIGEAVVAMEYMASSEDLARIIHAHPTLSEALHEAALAVDGRAIHI